MLYTEQTAGDNVRNREGKRVFYLGKNDRLTPGARDFLARQHIEILSAELARPGRYRLLSGGTLEEKPEELTHLSGDLLVPKSHPRIAFRGAMDTLDAELLLCRKQVSEPLQGQLGEILTLCRNLIRWEVMEEPVVLDKLCGLTAEELRSHSHRPQDYYGQPHFMPEYTDSQAILLLNRCRCAARSGELAAVRAFTDENGVATRRDILQAMNRISSMLYILMIREKAEKRSGNHGTD